MGMRPYCVCLSLLAVLGAGGAPASAGVLALSSSSASLLPIDVGGLSPTFCEEVRANKGTDVPIVKCTVKVRNLFADASLLLVPAGPVSTACGVWDATMAIAAIHLPVSPGDIKEIPEGSGQGAFAGVLATSTRLHLANRETGETADLSFRLGTGLTGPGPAGESGGAGSLISLEKRGQELEMTFKSCVPEWTRQVFPELEIVEADCMFCPDPANECADPDQGDSCAPAQTAP